MKLGILLLSLFLALVAYNKGSAQSKEETLLKPTMLVSLENQRLRENESLTVTVLISNESKYELFNTELIVDAPDFLNWHEKECNEAVITREIKIGTILPNSVIKRRFCVEINSWNKSKVGDFNILFTLNYSAQFENKTLNSFITSEKAIKVDVFGTDSIAGVPLAFAVFIVPGMFFWLVLRLWKIPFSLTLGAEEKLTLSVVFSIICLALATLLNYLIPSPQFPLKWIKYFDTSSEISIPKLLALAVTGFILGMICGIAYFLIQKHLQNRRREEEKSKLITTNDDEYSIVKKILLLNPDYMGMPIKVRIKDQGEFIGAHYAETVDDFYLVCSFQVETQQLPNELQKKLESYKNRLPQNTENINSVLELIGTENKKDVKMSNPIKQPSGINPNLTEHFYKWKKENVISYTRNVSENLPLLILA